MGNKKVLKIGNSNFRTIIQDNGYFVDKTMLIKDFWDNSSYILLMTRPKRFGKTLNLSMIEHFYDIEKPESKGHFTGFNITKHEGFCRKYQNSFPIINISLKSIKETTWDKCLEKFKGQVSELYEKYYFLLESEKLRDNEKQFFERIINLTANETECKVSLAKLSKYLYKHYGKQVIILVDEYDTPIISAFKYTTAPIKRFEKGELTYYEKVINFMQGFLGDAYKGNEALLRGMLTGVMRVGKGSIFSEWNNFSVFGITSVYFADSFGFTKEETEEILNYFHLQNQLSEIQKWYNGYKFGNTKNIYNPWSIVNYIAREKEGFKPYWVNTGDYSLIKTRIIELGVKDKLQSLIEGEHIDKELKDNFVFQDFETDNELLWTLLTDNGYLTQVEKSKYGNYKLKIPNNEVKIVFTDIIMTWLNTELKIKRDLLIETAEHLIHNRINEFEAGFKCIVGDTLSYFDTAAVKTQGRASLQREQIYHVYTLGLLTILTDDYIIRSNRESKHGRYDVMLIPHNKEQNGVVIEIKYIDKQRENEALVKFHERINNEIDAALGQIEKNEYYTELLIHKIEPEKIIKMAIIFAGKEPYVNKL